MIEMQLTEAEAAVINERRRQQAPCGGYASVQGEGYGAWHDDQHDRGELAIAAACYAAGSTFEREDTHPKASRTITRRLWPWDMDWWKPTTPRRNLVKAAALCIAEIERLDRAAAKEGE